MKSFRPTAQFHTKGDVAYSALLCRADLPYPAALVSAPDGPDGGGEPKSTEAPWRLKLKVGEGQN